MPIATFLTQVETHLKSGIATEHTYRAALQQLFNSILAPAQATNEPKHAAYGAPDFVIQRGNVPLGHVEAKDVGVALGAVIADSERANPKTENGKQLRRYRAALPNLLYTDGLEWHWFVGGEARLQAPLRVATWDKAKNKLAVSATASGDLTNLLAQFGAQQAATVGRPDDLARRLAQIARWLHDVIVEVFNGQSAQGELHGQYEAFRKTLLPTLKPDEFADMYAQTIVYGLFAARVAGPIKNTFSRFDAATTIPKTNPFLRKLFQEIAGYDLDERIAWLVDDCAHLLERTDMAAVLRDFGKATRREDPVVHFYETFLAAYDPKLREARGVYYTPEPVVGFIVRSVDRLLQTHFNKPMGLADDKTIILDPATGTATFLHAVIQHIHATLHDQGMAGLWNQYVPQKLLPRVFGFELLMAPYTVAHLKLGLLLKELGYDVASGERLGVYLTNALEDAPGPQQTLPFAQYIAEEGKAANEVKHGKPVMVVLGNPPYSGHSANTGEWIKGLVDDYKKGDPNLSKPGQGKWLQDDYVKFIRFGQWRINQTGEGILAFITNNGYLDNPTFREMRRSLLQEFDAIYILNLHGSSKKGDRGPDGESDENVFDIQQGVAIAIFTKKRKSTIIDQQNFQAEVLYADLWGERDTKYTMLNDQDVISIPSRRLIPSAPFYLLVPQDVSLLAEYEHGWKLPNIMDRNGDPAPGIVTTHDEFAISWSLDDANQKVEQFLRTTSEQEARSIWRLCSQNQWSYAHAKRALELHHWHSQIIPILYRPFDNRWTVFDSNVAVHRRERVMSQMLVDENVALLTDRQVNNTFQHIFCSDLVINDCTLSTATKERSYIFPLYLYPSASGTRRQAAMFEDTTETSSAPGGRRANLAPAFIAEVTAKLGVGWVADGRGSLIPHPLAL